MAQKIDQDVARFKAIVKGRIKKELHKFVSTGELIGKKGRDIISIPIPRVDIPHFVYGDKQAGGVGQGEGEQGKAVGKGEAFYQLLLRGTALPVVAMHPGRASKGERFQKNMAPLFQFGRAWVSSALTPFTRAFEEEWVGWPHAPHDDTLDAVYYMLRAARGYLEGGRYHGSSQAGRNPLAGLGRR